MKTFHHGHLVLVAILFAALAGTIAPAQAQARWKPSVESITVKAGALKDWRMAMTATHLGKAFSVSASIPVPYDDLDLVKDLDVSELTRRIQVAARLVCQELDTKYPPTQFPILEGYSGYDCVRVTARDSMEQANIVIASAKH